MANFSVLDSMKTRSSKSMERSIDANARVDVGSELFRATHSEFTSMKTVCEHLTPYLFAPNVDQSLDPIS
jgi:hypothetical protein